MNALATPKPSLQNRLEGIALTAIFQGFPAFVAVTLMAKLAHHQIAGGPLPFVVAASLLHAVLTPWLATKFPKFVRHGYEPLFFDAGLSFAEKIMKWRERPTTSVHLVTGELMLAVLAVAVVGMG